MDVPEAVSAAWQATTEAWDESKRHDAFVALVAQYGCFAWAAARYKERAGDPIADRQLERVTRAATATMVASSARRAADEAPYKRLIGIALAMFAVLILGIILTVILHAQLRH